MDLKGRQKEEDAFKNDCEVTQNLKFEICPLLVLVLDRFIEIHSIYATHL